MSQQVEEQKSYAREESALNEEDLSGDGSDEETPYDMS